MTHRKGAVWTERLLLILIVASLAGTFNLVLTMHRRYDSSATPAPAEISNSAPVPSIPPVPSATKVAGASQSSAKGTLPPLPAPLALPVEDPTIKALAGLARLTEKEVDAEQAADRRTVKLETAAKAAITESARWKRREVLVRQQVAALTQRAKQIEQGDLELEAERDVLAQERDALKAALTKAGQHSGNAVLPYKGPNGTWRRPIVIECTGNVAVLQPQGKTFSMIELSPLIHPRSSPVVLTIAREMMHIQNSATPDGAPAVPYLVFLVRPNGIRPYYESRARLEPLGIAFGYELIEQDLVVEVPDFDDLTTWDGSAPLDKPALASANRNTRSSKSLTAANDASGTQPSRMSGVWPPDDSARSGSSTPGAWPPSPENGGPAGSGFGLGQDRLAQADGLPGRPAGSGADSGPLSGERLSTEVALGRYSAQGSSRGNAGRSRSEDSSPQDFIWPGNSTNPGPGNGGGPAATGAGTGADRFAGDRTGSGPGSSPTYSPLSPAPHANGMGNGGATLVPLSSATAGQAGSGTEIAGRTAGRSGRSPGTGSSVMNAEGRGGFQPGTGGAGSAVSSSGSAPGSSSTSGLDKNGFGPGGPDPLPDLEPAQDGSVPVPATGGPLSRSPSASGVASESSGTGKNPSGTGTNPTRGSAASTGAGGQGGQPTPADPNSPGSNSPASSATGSTPADPGFRAYPAGGATPGGIGPGSGTAGSQPGGGSGSGNLDSNTTGGPDSPSQATGTPPSSAGFSSDSSASGRSVSSPPSGLNGATNAPPEQVGSSPSLSQPSQPLWGSTPSADSIASTGGSTTSNRLLGSMISGVGSESSDGSSSSSAGGQSGGAGTPAPGSGMSLPSLGANPDSDSDAMKEFVPPMISPPDRPPGAIEVPFEIVVVCRQNDILLHPGGYRLSVQALRAGSGKGSNPKSLLEQDLRALARRRAELDPLIRPKPSVRFLVENDGGRTFWMARRQLMFSGLNWPMSLQVAGPQSPHVFKEETWDELMR